uniref:BPTI/Kunitz inhibitor domain-containing protein n=1 Tax=Brugia timori TaxID=42155 RepID=A0A0R3QZN9_9BILA
LARASFAVNNSSDTRQITNICMQDVNTGKCTEAHLRFFYDRRVNTCRLFYYSGCGGNENNFATEEECQQQCKSDKAYDEDVSPGSCPYGEPPLGDNAPVICGKDAGSFECPKGYYCRMGPPNVCCLEKLLPVSEKILVTKKHHENIRFAQPKVKTSENVGYQFDEKQKENDAENSPLAITSTNICPDGTDALLDESTQQPLKCGLGYDGQSFCPVGYYCSIDSEKNGRLCCQLGVVGVKIPPPPKIPPYFGLRPSNPGEIIPRGSLPSDYVSLKQR